MPLLEDLKLKKRWKNLFVIPSSSHHTSVPSQSTTLNLPFPSSLMRGDEPSRRDSRGDLVGDRRRRSGVVKGREGVVEDVGGEDDDCCCCLFVFFLCVIDYFFCRQIFMPPKKSPTVGIYSPVTQNRHNTTQKRENRNENKQRYLCFYLLFITHQVFSLIDTPIHYFHY